jgi:hypothetical protein
MTFKPMYLSPNGKNPIFPHKNGFVAIKNVTGHPAPSIRTLGIMTFRITMLFVMKVSVMVLSIMTLSIKTVSMTSA